MIWVFLLYLACLSVHQERNIRVRSDVPSSLEVATVHSWFFTACPRFCPLFFGFLMFPLTASSILSILFICCYSNTVPLILIPPVLDTDSDPLTSTYCFHTENNFSVPLQSWQHFLKSFPIICPSTTKTEHSNGERFRKKAFTKSPIRSGRINELKDKRHCGEFSGRRTECSDSLCLDSTLFALSLVEHIKLKLSMKWQFIGSKCNGCTFSFKD